mmetsp:Transcript_10648/g.13476  ORF Transcript_10648/g.13476 Transcript_10648/m.13476 type:complete len:292 (-) Transcript_10648:179-1054(-)
MADRYGNQYGGGGDASFSSPSGGNNYGSSSQSPTQKRKSTDEQTLIPVTIRMILNASDSMLEDGREPHNIKIVAALRNVNQTSTSYVYEVEDGTGFIEAKEWLDENESVLQSEMRNEAAKDYQYVRIIGKMQWYDNKPSVVAYSVRKLSTGNELTHHLLEVVHASEKYKKSSQIVGSPSMNNGAMSMQGMNMGRVDFNSSMPSASTRLAPQDSNMESGGGGGNADSLRSETLNWLGAFNTDNPEGANINDFIQLKTGQYSRNEILSMIELLAQEGAIYSTSDESHYLLIDN